MGRFAKPKDEVTEELVLTAEELDFLDAKYDDDPIAFMEDCLMIRPKEGGLIPFRPNPQQKRLVAEMERQRKAGLPVRVIILKARQIGFSTVVQAYFVWRLSRNRHLSALVLAHKSEASKNMFRMFVTYIENMPMAFKPNMKTKNEALGNLELGVDDPSLADADPAYGSTLKVETAENQNAGRSGTYQMVHASEVAFWPYAETFTSLKQAVADKPGTVFVLESTANGATGQFYNMWKMAEAAQRKRDAGLPLEPGDSEYVAIFVAWWQHDEYRMDMTADEEAAWKRFREALQAAVDAGGDEDWRKHFRWDDDGTLKLSEDEMELARLYPVDYGQVKWRRWAITNKCDGDIDRFFQEYPASPDEAFLASGRPFFDAKQVIGIKNDVTKTGAKPTRYTIDEATSKLRGVPVIEPDPWGELYVFPSVDGSGLCLPTENGRYAIGADVAEGTEDGDNNAAHVVDVYTMEHMATIWGKMDPDVYGEKLFWLGMWFNEALIGPELNAAGQATVIALEKLEYRNLWGTGWPYRERIKEHGWRTGVATRKPMLTHFKTAMREGAFRPKMVEWLDEMLVFKVNAKGKAEAERGKNDDLVMAGAITLQMREQAFEQIPYMGYLGGVTVGSGRSVLQ